MSAEAVGTALAALLRERGHPCEVAVTGRATVGLSQATWFARLTTAEGTAEEVVVRLPTGASGHRAILTQRAALEAVADTAVPAPAIRWAEDGADNPFGAPVIVMSRLPGEVPAGWHEAYAAAGGVALDAAVLRWELVMAHLRLVYYAASGAAAFRAGVSSDLRLAALAHHLPVQLDRLAAALLGDPIG